MTEKYLTVRDREILTRAPIFRELAPVALRILKKMPKPIGEVCGAISTGGESRKENIELFKKAIKELTGQGLNIFDQIPFEDAIARIKNTPHYRCEQQLLEELYLPIFKSGLINTLYFLPNWRSSYGARWEHFIGGRLGLKIVYTYWYRGRLRCY